MMFARQLAKQNLFDPQNANRRKTGTYSLYTKENIMSWLQSPGATSNAKNLRNASIYLYNSFNQYSRLIDYYAGLPLWAYVISPVAFNPGKVKDDVFKRQYLKVTQFFEDMNIPHEMHKAMKIALREGAFYGVFRKESGSCFIQKLNPDNCLISSISDGTYVFLYDMSSITDEQDLEILYPPEFSEMHRNYKKTGKPYQEVPDSISFCLKADDSVNDYTIPPFSSVMPLLLDISNYMDLQQTATELRNYAVLTGVVPTNADGTPQMDWPLVVEYLKQIYNALPPQIGCVAAPWKIDQVSFNKNDGATDADLISRSADNFWSAAGTTPALHGSAIETSGGLKLAITADEMFAFGIMTQAERLINRYLKSFGGSVTFKIQFLPVSRYNQSDMIKLYKEASTYGLGKSLYCASLGIPQYDVNGLDYIERNIMNLGSLTPLQSSHTMSGTDEGTTGRPELKDIDLTDEGQRSKDRR